MREILQFNEWGLVNRFQSVSDASRETGVNRGSIVNVSSGRAKSAGGFTWMYSSDYIKEHGRDKYKELLSNPLNESIDKKEKYINFIVNDLMKNTYQSDSDRIHTPVRYEGDGENYFINVPFHEDIEYLLTESSNFIFDIKLLLNEHYGVHETEYDIIMDRYRESLLKKFPNYG